MLIVLMLALIILLFYFGILKVLTVNSNGCLRITQSVSYHSQLIDGKLCHSPIGNHPYGT